MTSTSTRASRFLTCVVSLCAFLLSFINVTAQESAPREPVEKQWQTRIEERYREFEALLDRTADLLRPTEPDRAALLARAFSQSRKDLILVQLREVVAQLENGKLGEAAKDQQEVLSAMNAILELLVSEDRAETLRREQEAMAARLKEIERLSSQQRKLRARSERSDKKADSATELSDAQEKLADETKSERDKKDSSTEKPTTKKDGDPSKSPKPNGDSKEPGPSKEQTPSDASKSQSPNSKPGDENLKSAEKSMRDASKDLQQSQRQAATKKQDEALKELQKAAEETEEKLRQLREEERQEILAALEARITKLLEMQKLIYDETLAIERVPIPKRTRIEEQKSIQLARREEEVVAGLDGILAILVDDGTAVAFPETIEQSARDAEEVVRRLKKAQVDSLTVKIEKDIIDTLGDLAQSLEKEMKKQKSGAAQSGAGGGSQKSPLIEKIAELKMIRSLEKRILERTIEVDKSRTSNENQDVNETVRDLADRQHRVYEITRGISEGPRE